MNDVYIYIKKKKSNPNKSGSVWKYNLESTVI